jgi:Tol biopolymer transport system component
VSPDGKLIASEYWDEESSSPFRLALISFADGSLGQQFDFPKDSPVPREEVNLIRWKDASTITYVGNKRGVSNIWGQSITGGQPIQLTHFTSDKILWFDWSRDGKRLAYARGLFTSDVVLFVDSRR